MYSFSYLEPVCCFMLISNCCFLTCIQVSQEAGQVVWYSHLFQSFPVFGFFFLVHSVKGFVVINKAEIDVFLELSWFFDDPAEVGNLISGSSDFSKSSLNIWKFTVHVLLKPGLENFEHFFASVWDKCNCAVVWILCHCLFLGLEWKLTFSSPVATPVSQNLFRFTSIESVMLSISSSAGPLSFCLQSFPASGSFSMSQLIASGGQSNGASASVSVLPMNIQGWFLLELTGLISFLSKGLSRVFFSINSSVLGLCFGPTLTFLHDY